VDSFKADMRYKNSVLWDKGNIFNRINSMTIVSSEQRYIIPIDHIVNKFWLDLSRLDGNSRLPQHCTIDNVLHAVHVNFLFICPALTDNLNLFNTYVNDAFDLELYLLNNRVNTMTQHEADILKKAYIDFAIGFYFIVNECKIPLFGGFFQYENATDKIVIVNRFNQN
jgi:hypothetical protein